MNKLQNKLYELLTKFERICQKHNITYYLGGGTALGAIRHHGFIPWDDDIDLYITRENLQKIVDFREEFEKEGLVYLDHSLYKNYSNCICRLVDEKSTMMIASRMIDDHPKGYFLELFILDAMPLNLEEKFQWRKKHWVYTELINTNFRVANHNIVEYIDKDLYNFYLERCNSEGREQVIKELEHELFTIDIDESDEYCLRWGGNDVRIKKEWVGTPRYVTFEKTELPVLPGAEGGLRAEYGESWMYIPEINEQKPHDIISNDNKSYVEYVQAYKSVIDRPKLIEAYNKRKYLSPRFYFKSLEILDKQQDAHRVHVIDKLKKYGKTLEELNRMERDRDFNGIEKNFELWYSLQFSSIFKPTKSFLNIGDENLYYALLPLIKKGDYIRAKNVLSWRTKKLPITDKLKILSDFLNIISELYIKLYDNELKNQEDLILKIDSYREVVDSYDADYLKVSFLYYQASRDKKKLEHLEEQVYRLSMIYRDRVEFLGLLADIKFDLCKLENVINLYNEVRENTKNGMLLLHVNERLNTLIRGKNDESTAEDNSIT